VQFFVAQSPALAETFQPRLQDKPCTLASPWSIILYCDEVTPGNVLRPDNRRKIQRFYMTFKELGAEVLSHAEAWFPLATLRSTVCKQVEGKLSCAMRAMLRGLFVGPAAFDRTGVVLQLPQGPTVLLARLTNMLGDESALRAVWSSKGAAGLLPCLLCKNICTRDLSAEDASSYLQDLSCSSAAALDLASDADIIEKVDALRAMRGHSTRAQFERQEKAYGLTFCATGVLADDDLRHAVRPASIHTYDSMHVYFSNGICSFETHLFLQAARPVGVTMDMVKMFMSARWQWPAHLRSKGRDLHSLFTPARQGASPDSFKASASEMLMLMPMLRHFVETVIRPTGQLGRESSSMLALCAVTDELQAIKRGGGSVAALTTAIRDHMTLFGLAHGREAFKPKHHYALHLAAQIQRDEGLLDCFVLERKHQKIKAICQAIDNTRAFERSALPRVIQEQLRELSAPGWAQLGLRGRRLQCPSLAASQGASEAEVAPAVIGFGVTASAGDVVVAQQGQMYRVECAACVDGRLCLVARGLRHVRQVASKAWACLPGAELQLLDFAAQRPQQAACWTDDPAGDLVVLV